MMMLLAIFKLIGALVHAVLIAIFVPYKNQASNVLNGAASS